MSLRIIWFLADVGGEWNTSAHRVMTPHKRMTEAGHHSFVTHIAEVVSGKVSDETKSELKQADVIVIERLPIAETHGFIELNRKMGKQVWITFDDHYAIMPDSISRDTWRGGKGANRGRGAILNEFRKGLRLATGFMTPSKLLCKEYQMYNERAAFVSNYLDPEAWQNLASPNPDIVTIGYGGTSLHNVSLKESDITPAFGRLCKESPKLQVHLQPAFEDVVGIFKRSGVNLSIGRWEPFEAWPRTVSQFHIGVAPLSGNYDMYRSSLKVLEYATLGIPWVATDAPPYKEARGGILVSNRSHHWYGALKELLTNESLYRRLSEEGRAWAQAHNDSCVKRYEEVFSGRI